MISVDTNVFLYGLNEDCREFETARGVIADLGRSANVVVCELVLVELYLLVRNPKVLRTPLSGADAADVCEAYRRHPRWRLVAGAPVMDEVWKLARQQDFARRRIVDARLALTLRHHGVTEIITRNERDFRDFGFERVTNPFD